MCTSNEQLMAHLDSLVELGAEGLILNKPEAVYHVGRSHEVLKVKVKHLFYE